MHFSNHVHHGLSYYKHCIGLSFGLTRLKKNGFTHLSDEPRHTQEYHQGLLLITLHNVTQQVAPAKLTYWSKQVLLYAS